AIGRGRLRERFPTIDAAVRRHGADWSRTPVPVTPAAHYWMGGIRTALDGATSRPGLFAAGECARTGVHGANRLASNSLREGAVFGARAGQAAAAAARHAGASIPAPRPGPVRYAPSACGSFSRRELQRLMWSRAGLLRIGAELDELAGTLATWRAPEPASADPLPALEDRNLLDLARLLVDRARARRDSVGAHHRLDAPITPAQEHHACSPPPPRSPPPGSRPWAPPLSPRTPPGAISPPRCSCPPRPPRGPSSPPGSRACSPGSTCSPPPSASPIPRCGSVRWQPTATAS